MKAKMKILERGMIEPTSAKNNDQWNDGIDDESNNSP
jgi:hypothetical protein